MCNQSCEVDIGRRALAVVGGLVSLDGMRRRQDGSACTAWTHAEAFVADVPGPPPALSPAPAPMQAPTQGMRSSALHQDAHALTSSACDPVVCGAFTGGGKCNLSPPCHWGKVDRVCKCPAEPTPSPPSPSHRCVDAWSPDVCAIQVELGCPPDSIVTTKCQVRGPAWAHFRAL